MKKRLILAALLALSVLMPAAMVAQQSNGANPPQPVQQSPHSVHTGSATPGWAAACGALLQLGDSNSFALSALLLVGMFPSALSGLALSERRWRVLSGTPVSRMTSVYAVDIKVCSSCARQQQHAAAPQQLLCLIASV